MRGSIRTRRRVAIALPAVGALLGLAVIAAFNLAVPDRNASPVQKGEHGTVAYVVNGDTIAVTRDGHTVPERVRLIGIDTPELGHGKGPDECWAAEARDELKTLLPQGTEVALSADPSQPDVDKYGRLRRRTRLVSRRWSRPCRRTRHLRCRVPARRCRREAPRCDAATRHPDRERQPTT